MAKKRTKTPTEGRITTRTTEAPKLVTRPADETVVAPVVTPAAPVLVASPIMVDRASIARLAFDKYVARGRAPGHHVQDWLEAEAELRRRNASV